MAENNTKTIIKTEPISSPVHPHSQRHHTCTVPQDSPSRNPSIQHEDNEAPFVFQAPTPPVTQTYQDEDEDEIYLPSSPCPHHIKQEGTDSDDNDEEEYTSRISPPRYHNIKQEYHSQSRFLSSSSSPPFRISKPTTKKHSRLSLKLRCLHGLPLQPPPPILPQTPFNMSDPASMTPALNYVRRAAFEEYIRVGVTPLIGKEKDAREARDMSDFFEDTAREEEEVKEKKVRGRRTKEKESCGLRWFRNRLWGRGKWAIRGKFEEGVRW